MQPTAGATIGGRNKRFPVPMNDRKNKHQYGVRWYQVLCDAHKKFDAPGIERPVWRDELGGEKKYAKSTNRQ